MADEPKWEQVAPEAWRLAVPGGWLYWVGGATEPGGVVFVPDSGDREILRSLREAVHYHADEAISAQNTRDVALDYAKRQGDELAAANLTLANLRKRYRADACGCAPGTCDVADRGLDAHREKPVEPGWVRQADGSWRRP